MAILFFNLHNQNKVWLFNKQQTHHTVIWVLFFIKNGKPYVFESASKVVYTPLHSRIARGKNKNYVIKRLKNGKLSNNEIVKLKQVASVFEGRPYDIWFGWDNKYIYCSELVWEIYDNALT
ncbi:YiiX/YebB-like N1pC/P60 family cysteine hydrolase [Gilliamella sp. Bif1-4]|uniref:YiiX/YebB-like N1pC/P60 family cysteine hydrolase n=1 Tax=Gilliamella sp. Bif1-4 TaxID=3120233 RepID=UPI001C3FFE89|nr:YiiX/YebB-like N1pC/P60 family cysteine hydrolase [Gilliamella apicola]